MEGSGLRSPFFVVATLAASAATGPIHAQVTADTEGAAASVTADFLERIPVGRSFADAVQLTPSSNAFRNIGTPSLDPADRLGFDPERLGVEPFGERPDGTFAAPPGYFTGIRAQGSLSYFSGDALDDIGGYGNVQMNVPITRGNLSDGSWAFGVQAGARVLRFNDLEVEDYNASLYVGGPIGTDRNYFFAIFGNVDAAADSTVNRTPIAYSPALDTATVGAGLNSQPYSAGLVFESENYGGVLVLGFGATRLLTFSAQSFPDLDSEYFSAGFVEARDNWRVGFGAIRRESGAFGDDTEYRASINYDFGRIDAGVFAAAPLDGALGGGDFVWQGEVNFELSPEFRAGVQVFDLGGSIDGYAAGFEYDAGIADFVAGLGDLNGELVAHLGFQVEFPRRSRNRQSPYYQSPFDRVLTYQRGGRLTGVLGPDSTSAAPPRISIEYNEDGSVRSSSIGGRTIR